MHILSPKESGDLQSTLADGDQPLRVGTNGRSPAHLGPAPVSVT